MTLLGEIPVRNKSIGNPAWNKPLETPENRCKNNIKMDM